MKPVPRSLARGLKLLRSWWVILPVAVAACLFQLGFLRWDSTEMARRVEERCSSGEELIDFAADFDLDWDRMFVIHPYAAKVRVESLIGRPWPDEARTRSASSDAFSLVVFLSGDRIVCWYDQSRWIEFTGTTDGDAIPREEARFRVVRLETPSGEPDGFELEWVGGE